MKQLIAKDEVSQQQYDARGGGGRRGARRPSKARRRWSPKASRPCRLRKAAAARPWRPSRQAQADLRTRRHGARPGRRDPRARRVGRSPRWPRRRPCPGPGRSSTSRTRRSGRPSPGWSARSSVEIGQVVSPGTAADGDCAARHGLGDRELQGNPADRDEARAEGDASTWTRTGASTTATSTASRPLREPGSVCCRPRTPPATT